MNDIPELAEGGPNPNFYMKSLVRHVSHFSWAQGDYCKKRFSVIVWKGDDVGKRPILV